MNATDRRVDISISLWAERFIRRHGRAVYIWTTDVNEDWARLHASVQRPKDVAFEQHRASTLSMQVVVTEDLNSQADRLAPIDLRIGLRLLPRPRVVALWDVSLIGTGAGLG